MLPLHGAHRLPAATSGLAKRQPVWVEPLARQLLQSAPHDPQTRALKQLPASFGSSMSSPLLPTRLAPQIIKGAHAREVRPGMPSLLDAAAAGVGLTVVDWGVGPWREQIEMHVPGGCLPCSNCSGRPCASGGYEHYTKSIASTTTFKAIIDLTGQRSFLKSGRSKCGACGVIFRHADRETLAGLNAYGLYHLTADVPFSLEAAQGDLIFSREAESDLVAGVSRGTTPGAFAARLTENQAKHADRSYATYLSQGRLWFAWLEANVGDAAWAALSLKERASDFWVDARAEYSRYRDEPNKVEALDESEIGSQRAYCFYPVSHAAASDQYLESFQSIYEHVKNSLSNVGSQGWGLFAIDDNKSVASVLGGQW